MYNEARFTFHRVDDHAASQCEMLLTSFTAKYAHFDLGIKVRLVDGTITNDYIKGRYLPNKELDRLRAYIHGTQWLVVYGDFKDPFSVEIPRIFPALMPLRAAVYKVVKAQATTKKPYWNWDGCNNPHVFSTFKYDPVTRTLTPMTFKDIDAELGVKP